MLLVQIKSCNTRCINKVAFSFTVVRTSAMYWNAAGSLMCVCLFVVYCCSTDEQLGAEWFATCTFLSIPRTWGNLRSWVLGRVSSADRVLGRASHLSITGLLFRNSCRSAQVDHRSSQEIGTSKPVFRIVLVCLPGAKATCSDFVLCAEAWFASVQPLECPLVMLVETITVMCGKWIP